MLFILGAGDIKNIIQVLKVAMEVQIDRLVNAKDQNEYANAYTFESVDMMGDILERPESWFGIPKGILKYNIYSRNVEICQKTMPRA